MSDRRIPTAESWWIACGLLMAITVVAGCQSEAASTPDRAHRVIDMTFDDITFEMEVGEAFDRTMLTEDIHALDGKQVRIRGYILPTAQKHGLKEFVLVRDNMLCCFGPGAALYDCILVEMKPGQMTNFSLLPVAVEGTFGFEEIFGLDGSHLSIYHMRGEEVD